jgi:2-methylcitrate dehydratase PrpD
VPTLIETMADWAVRVRPADVPPRVVDAARAQLRSVVASVWAGAGSHAGRGCRDAALRIGGEGGAAARATLLAGGERVSSYAALLANASASMAHDYDDYLFLGHTGHSAVLAALAVAEETDASVEDLLIAQVVANEIGGRLGAFVAIGPQNGQTWAHIHLAGAVVAAARLLKLSAEQAADALAIAFYQPPFTLFPGFMGSEAKALTAAQPAAMGLMATWLAAGGLAGMRSILEHPRGFARHFAWVPVPALLGGLGHAWVTDSMSCKIYPGCAYMDGPVDAALAARAGRPLRAADVESVHIEATALTGGMEALCEEAAPADSLEPIAITFSARRSVAIALLAGGLSPRQLEERWLHEHGDDVRAIAGRTRIEVSRPRTLSMLDGIDRAVPLASVARAAGARRFWQARGQLSDMARTAFKPRGDEHAEGVESSSSMSSLGKLIRGAYTVRRFARAKPLDMARVDFDKLEFRFGAQVTIRLHGGEELTAEARIPLGAAGSGIGRINDLMVAKLQAEAAAAGHPDRAAAMEALLARAPAQTSARALAAAAAGQLHLPAS